MASLAESHGSYTTPRDTIRSILFAYKGSETVSRPRLGPTKPEAYCFASGALLRLDRD